MLNKKRNTKNKRKRKKNIKTHFLKNSSKASWRFLLNENNSLLLPFVCFVGSFGKDVFQSFL